MTFSGWPLATLGPLFAVGATLITGLYLLRMRRREVVVPFAALWAQIARQSESRRLWKRLRRVLSWLLQLLILALLCLALGDPRPEVWFRDPQTVAIVIDRSASMGARSSHDAPSTRLDAALERAEIELAALSSRDEALILTVGQDVEVLAPLSGDPSVWSSALQELTPSYGDADLGHGLALARHALQGRSGARMLIITDGALGPAAREALESCGTAMVPCAVHTVGGVSDNVAITAFAARRYPHATDRVEVLTEIRNLGDTPATFDLDITAAGVSVGRRRLTLDPGTIRHELLSELDAARSQLVARLQPVGTDASWGPIFDDEAHAVVPPMRPLDVILVNDGQNLFLEAALLSLGEHIRLTGLSVSAIHEEPPPRALQEADLIILDPGSEVLPLQLPATDRVFFDPWRHPESPCPIAKKADVTRPFLTEQDRKHPLFDHVVLKDVNISRGTTFRTEPGDSVLARSLGEPVVVLRERDEHLDLAIGFDLRQSDLPLRTAFPLLVDNIVRYVEQRSPGFVASVPLGTSPPIALAELGLDPRGLTRVRVEGPAVVAGEVPVDAGHVRVRTRAPGVVSITALDGPQRGVRVELAAQAGDPEASDLHSRVAPQSAPIAESVAPPAPSGWVDRPLWLLLVLVVASIVAIEWATYHRRVTV